MFTGIVTDVGTVRAVRETNRDLRFEVETRFDLSTVDIGASISHAGCCLTVVEYDATRVSFDVLEETRRLTNFSALAPGALVNLERSLRFDGKVGGHFVTGHIDGLGIVEIDAHQLGDREIALTILGGTDFAFDRVAGAQADRKSVV